MRWSKKAASNFVDPSKPETGSESKEKRYFNNSSRNASIGQCRSKFVAKKLEITTTTRGNPLVDNQNSITAGPRGPLLMQDRQLPEKLAHQNSKRIPERSLVDH
jgi:hypothetical protein